jgi:SsrA-binding protein
MHLQEVRSMPREKGRTLIAQNKKARHDYSIEDVFEAGMVLTGTEVKSLRAGRASLVDGYATIDDGEVWLRGIHIPEYNMGTWTNHDPRRARKLLLRREEVRRLVGTMKESGFTLVPLALYFKDGYAKVEIAVARGRKAHDKRQAIAERESKRETERALGRVRRGE